LSIYIKKKSVANNLFFEIYLKVLEVRGWKLVIKKSFGISLKFLEIRVWKLVRSECYIYECYWMFVVAKEVLLPIWFRFAMVGKYMKV